MDWERTAQEYREQQRLQQPVLATRREEDGAGPTSMSSLGHQGEKKEEEEERKKKKKQQEDDGGATGNDWIRYETSEATSSGGGIGASSLWFNPVKAQVSLVDPAHSPAKDPVPRLPKTGMEDVLAAVAIARAHMQAALQSPSSTSLTQEMRSTLMEMIKMAESLDLAAKHSEGKGSRGSARFDDSTQATRSLLAFSELPWRFEGNARVAQYREVASHINYQKVKENWKEQQLPVYWSDRPLPSKVEKGVIQVHINLPKSDNPVMGALEKTSILVNPSDTVDKALKYALSKMPSGIGKEEAMYVVRVEGRQDYLLPGHKFSAFDAVRSVLREEKSLRLTLSSRAEAVGQSVLKTVATPSRDSTKAPGNSPKTSEQPQQVLYPEVESQPWQAPSSVPLSEVHAPFTLKVTGVDNLTHNALPRLDQLHSSSPNARVFIFLRTFLFYGDEILAGTENFTPIIPLGSQTQVLFHSSANMGLACSQIPREARLAFELYAIVGNKDKSIVSGAAARSLEGSKNSILLAWSVQQMMDARGVLATGRLALSLWPLPSIDKSHPDKGSSFIFSSTNKHNLTNLMEGREALACVALVELPEFDFQVIAPLYSRNVVPKGSPDNESKIPISSLPASERKRLALLCTDADPL
jgi:hypothetical protein